MIAFDLTKPDLIDPSLDFWLQTIDATAKTNFNVIVVGTYLDLVC